MKRVHEIGADRLGSWDNVAAFCDVHGVKSRRDALALSDALVRLVVMPDREHPNANRTSKHGVRRRARFGIMPKSLMPLLTAT